MADNSFKVKSGVLHITPQASPPSNPAVGDIYLDTSGVLYRYNGSSWISSGAGVAAVDITNTPAGGIAATNVQAAIDELDTEKASASSVSDHLSDSSDAHDASAISTVPAGGLSSSDVQSALNELDTEKTVKVTTTTDNALVRFDGIVGGQKNSGVTVDNSNNMVLPGTLQVDGASVDMADATTASLATTNTASTVNIGNGSGANTINIGGATSTINLTGTVNNQNVINLNVTDKLVTVNDGGAVSSGGAAGIEIEENGSITGYAQTSADRNSWEFKAPNTAGIASLTPGASADSVALLAATQAFTNKTINGSSNTITNVSLSTGVTGTLPATNGGTAQSTWTTGDLLYASASNTLSKLAIGSANQVLKTVAGIPSWAAAATGGINYLSSNYDAEVDTTGWTAFADAAATTPVDGTGGSPNSTWTRTASSPLRGSASFLWTKSSGASRQGEGVSYDFTIDPADRGKVLQGSFEYSIASGTFADDAMSVWIYDVTNATLIQPAPYLLKNHSLSAERFPFEFQTNTSSTSYRLIIFVPVSTDSSNTLKFDNFSIGPQAKLYGSPVTDWTAWTPTGSWSTNTTYTGFRRRIGDSEEYEVTVATSGAPTSAALTINLPSGITIDTAKLSNTATDGSESLGDGTVLDGATANYLANVCYNSTTSIAVRINNASSTYAQDGVVTQAVPFTFGATDKVQVRWKVPVLGWSSSVVMSGDADTRVVAAAYHQESSFTAAVAGYTDMSFDTKDDDTHNAMSGATYTIPVPGIYEISCHASFPATTGSGEQYNMRVQGTYSTDLDIYTTASTTSNYPQLRATFQHEYKAGNTLKIQLGAPTKTTSNTGALNRISIKRLSGPAQIAASESVAARATGSTTSVTSSVVTVINPTVTWDSHGAYNSSTGIFTAPVSGKYQITGVVLSGSVAWSATHAVILYYSLNGGGDVEMARTSAWASVTQSMSVNGSDVVRMLAGDTLKLRAYAAVTNTTVQSTVSFVRVGNY